jgi:dienelactone hydrolase
MERTARLLSAGEPEAAAAAFAGRFGSADAAAAANRWLEAPGVAFRNAPPADGPFPLVVIAQGNEQSAFDQAPLAEALAARGYVVATTPSPMRLDGPMQSAEEIGARAQVQAEDLAFAAAQVGAALPADLDRIAVLGHSFGARAALLLAMHDGRIRALVSLDGGIGTALGRDVMARAPWFDTAGTHAAILHFYEELDPYMAPDFTLLRAVAHGGLDLVPTAGMHHHHFTALGFAAAAEPEIARATGAGPELPASLDGLERRLFEFLAEHLGATLR